MRQDDDVSLSEICVMGFPLGVSGVRGCNWFVKLESVGGGVGSPGAWSPRKFVKHPNVNGL